MMEILRYVLVFGGLFIAVVSIVIDKEIHGGPWAPGAPTWSLRTWPKTFRCAVGGVGMFLTGIALSIMLR